MKIIRIQNSVLNSNSFILSDETYPYCWLVDVGDIEPIWKAIGNRQMKGVFLTHTHYDHIYGIKNISLNVWFIHHCMERMAFFLIN